MVVTAVQLGAERHSTHMVRLSVTMRSYWVPRPVLVTGPIKFTWRWGHKCMTPFPWSTEKAPAPATLRRVCGDSEERQWFCCAKAGGGSGGRK